MKKLLLMTVLALTSVFTFAQRRVGTTTIQPKIGLNVSTVGDLDWKAGFVFGAELQHQLDRKVAIAGGLLYSFQGGKTDGYSWNPGYINIPVTLNYYVSRGFALKAGLQPGFMVSKDNVSNVNTFDLAVPVGMSYEYGNFVIDGRYNIGVTKVPKQGDGYTNVLQFTIGYKFKMQPCRCHPWHFPIQATRRVSTFRRHAVSFNVLRFTIITTA